MNDPTPRASGFYWVRLGTNLPEVVRWHAGAWLLCGRDQPWPAEGRTWR